MSVDQTDVVDFVGLRPDSNEVLLVIFDHLEWTGDDQPDKLHMLILQEKINAYLGFIESGEIYKKCPKAKDREMVIMVYGNFR